MTAGRVETMQGVHDLEVSRARYRALLGTPELVVGDTRLVLVPRIAAREGPCAMQIRTSMRAKCTAGPRARQRSSAC